MRKIVWRLKSLWIQASLMRIYYSKHMSGALKFVCNFLQEGKELEPFHIIVHSGRCIYLKGRMVFTFEKGIKFV